MIECKKRAFADIFTQLFCGTCVDRWSRIGLHKIPRDQGPEALAYGSASDPLEPSPQSIATLTWNPSNATVTDTGLEIFDRTTLTILKNYPNGRRRETFELARTMHCTDECCVTERGRLYQGTVIKIAAAIDGCEVCFQKSNVMGLCLRCCKTHPPLASRGRFSPNTGAARLCFSCYHIARSFRTQHESGEKMGCPYCGGECVRAVFNGRPKPVCLE